MQLFKLNQGNRYNERLKIISCFYKSSYKTNQIIELRKEKLKQIFRKLCFWNKFINTSAITIFFLT